jgi:DNA-binding transcriptional regulator YhcF (GntR family)
MEVSEQSFSYGLKQMINLGNPNTISKNKKVLQNKDIVEMKGGKLVFVDPIYRQWFAREYE